MSSFVDGVVRTIPHTGAQAAVAAMLFTGNYKLYGYYLASYILSTEVLSKVAKRSFVKILPKNITRRPGNRGKGACGFRSAGVCTSCSVYARPGKRSFEPGFFSGHATSVFFNLVFWTIYCYQTDMTLSKRRAFSGLLLAAALAVAFNRISVGCHSSLQVLVGAVMGSIMAFVSYKILNQLEPDTFPSPYDLKNFSI